MNKKELEKFKKEAEKLHHTSDTGEIMKMNVLATIGLLEEMKKLVNHFVPPPEEVE